MRKFIKKIHRPRWLVKYLALSFGYFWLPCPICNEYFAGYEGGHWSLMHNIGEGTMVCRKAKCQEIAKESSEDVYRGYRGLEL